MKELMLALAILVALAIGAVVGYQYQLVHSTATYEFGEACKTFDLLRKWRAGDTNAAIDALEADLDMNVINLRLILDSSPRIEHAQGYTNLLRRIAAYRSVHPHHNDITNMDSLVVQALNSVATVTH
jgi:hypothetical protein